MKKEKRICICCGRAFVKNYRLKEQGYCNNKKCQRKRRARWQRGKMWKDKEYKENQKNCHREWIQRHPGYYAEYRRKRPEYVKRNKILQMRRDALRRKDKLGKFLAKMDSLKLGRFSRKGEMFRLVPQEDIHLAKMDSLIVKLVPLQGVMRL